MLRDSCSFLLQELSPLHGILLLSEVAVLPSRSIRSENQQKAVKECCTAAFGFMEESSRVSG